MLALPDLGKQHFYGSLIDPGNIYLLDIQDLHHLLSINAGFERSM